MNTQVDLKKAQETLARQAKMVAELERQAAFEQTLAEPTKMFLVSRNDGGYIYEVVAVFESEAMANQYVASVVSWKRGNMRILSVDAYVGKV